MQKIECETNENADSAIYSISKQKHKLRIIKINNANIHMLIDSGSSATVLDRNTFDRVKMKDPKIKLTIVKTNYFRMVLIHSKNSWKVYRYLRIE